MYSYILHFAVFRDAHQKYGSGNGPLFYKHLSPLPIKAGQRKMGIKR